MTVSLIYVLGIALCGFVVSRLVLGVLFTKMQGRSYALKYDAWLYILGLVFLGSLSVAYFTPAFHDQIVSLSLSSVILTVFLAAFIYAAFTLDNAWILNGGIVLSIIALLCLLPPENIVLSSAFPLLADRLILFALLFFLTRATTILNAQNGIFLIYALTVCFGLTFMAVLGGVPLVLGGFAALLGGVLSGFFNINALQEKIVLNKGACLSASFLLSALILYASAEYAFSATLVLTCYLPVEFAWAVVNYFLRHNKGTALSKNTAYSVLLSQDSSLYAIWVALAKIGLVNIILACFQLYAPNRFSLPIFTVILNLWLLSRLLSAFEPPETLKSANKQLVETIKQGIKEAFRKDQ